MKSARSTPKISKILAFDIGGTGLKASLIDAEGKMLADRLRMPTPYPCSPPVMVDALVELAKPLSGFECIAIGFPGVVRDGCVLTAPHFGTPQWTGFALASALSERLKGCPAKLINDAEMQGLAVISGKGLELVVTLGTGVGTALFRDGELMPHLELAQHPVRGKQIYNDYIGDRKLKKIGVKRWRSRVGKVVEILHELLYYDRLYIGGGNARRLDEKLLAELRSRASADSAIVKSDIAIISNDAGIEGGAALWRHR